MAGNLGANAAMMFAGGEIADGLLGAAGAAGAAETESLEAAARRYANYEFGPGDYEAFLNKFADARLPREEPIGKPNLVSNGYEGYNGGGNRRVLWSGGQNAFKAATEYATENGYKTLEQTITGKLLTLCQNTANKLLGQETAYKYLSPLWDKASARFVMGSDGIIHAFLNSQGISDSSVFMRIEYEIVKEHGMQIVFHLVK